jgi:hypothetical protein
MNMTTEGFITVQRTLLKRIRLVAPLSRQTINALRLFRSVQAIENFFNTIKAPKSL